MPVERKYIFVNFRSLFCFQQLISNKCSSKRLTLQYKGIFVENVNPVANMINQLYTVIGLVTLSVLGIKIHFPHNGQLIPEAK